MVVDVLINPHHTKTSVYHVLFASFFYTFFMSFIALFLFTQFASVVAIILTAITVTPFFFALHKKKRTHSLKITLLLSHQHPIKMLYTVLIGMWIGFFMFYMIATDYIRGILFSTALSIFHAQQFVTGIQFGHPMTLTILAICFALFLLAYIWGSGAVLLGAWLTNMVVVLSSLVFGMSLVQALYWIIMLCGAMIIHYGSTVLAIASINSHIGTKKFSVTALSALEIAFLGLLVICIADILYFFF